MVAINFRLQDLGNEDRLKYQATPPADFVHCHSPNREGGSIRGNSQRSADMADTQGNPAPAPGSNGLTKEFLAPVVHKEVAPSENPENGEVTSEQESKTMVIDEGEPQARQNISKKIKKIKQGQSPLRRPQTHSRGITGDLSYAC